MIDDEMRELLDSFIVETQEILENLDQDLMSLESSPEDQDLLNAIFRSFHTIKGTSSFMGFEQITGITHQAEDILNKLRRNELTVSTEIVDVLLEVYDWLKTLAKKVESGDEQPVDFSDTMTKLKRINAGESATDAADTSESAAESEPQAETNETAPEGSALSGVLNDPNFGAGEGEFSADELAMLEQAFAEVNQGFKKKSDAPKEDPTTTTEKDVKDSEKQAATAADEPKVPEASPPPKSAPAPAKDDAEPARNGKTAKPRPVGESTIRVDVDRLETLMDLSGELVLGRNRLTQITHDLGQKYENHDFIRLLQETSSQINFITTELQSAIMKTRMVPIAKLFQKAPRMVRDLSKEFNKEISLVLRGEETELDRGIIDELSDPLVHMIRNSCDHGIETTSEREAAGKPRGGTLTLDADQEGNHIVIRIIDNGKGIDPDKIKNKAIEKGVISSEQASQMSDREAYNLIFAPGFSTAEKVTSVSGRGVGMDVVRTNIQKLKGIIEVDSQKGQGTEFTIKLPLTLAIIQGLLVGIDNEIFAIPLSAVIEVVSTDQNKISSVNQREVIRIRDQVTPLVRLENALNLNSEERKSLDNRYVVIVGLADFRVGLVVDELLGQKEIVIKSLGEYLGHVKGIAGSTILGDGRVIMIIDITELIQSGHPTNVVANA